MPSAAIVPKIGDHHHGEPVERRVILACAQLQPEREAETEDADGCGDGHAVLTDEVGHRLPHPGLKSFNTQKITVISGTFGQWFHEVGPSPANLGHRRWSLRGGQEQQASSAKQRGRRLSS